MITLLGANGSMGVRYQAILDWLGVKYRAFDVDSTQSVVDDSIYQSTGLIVATPTHTHASVLKQHFGKCKQILCEKPISKSMDEVEELYSLASKTQTQFNVVMQYSELARSTDRDKESYYNYFRSGKDGLVWDCFQIIALARGPVWLSNESPIWDCKINGEKLSLSSMDGAYVSFIKRWLDNKLEQNASEMVKAHERAHKIAKDYYNDHNQYTNWYSGTI